jgi:hypothetical protein
MTNYTKTTDFAAKDALPSGNSAKIVKGSEIDTEFNNIATASATKANANSAALTGTTTFETISDGTIAITAFVDEDNMASDSATLLPTQQSVKAYVDSQVTAQDLDVTDGSTSIDIDLDSESLGILGGTGIDSTASGTGVTLAIDSTVATLTGSQTLTNKTLSAPVVSGNLTTDGLLDGRDVATDGTKLDGIESGATADQTAAEIKTAYESNADTNAFTDADESKLDGIEASADVTDTANVTAAGALMDSELTSEASVKALNQGVATTDSPTFAGLTTTADVSFGDNDKAIFGAGSDLQIYHDGTDSIINESTAGNLLVQGATIKLQTANGAKDYLVASPSAEVTLYHNNAAKLATTSTGIDVTGVITTDGMTTSADISFGDNDKAIFGADSDLQIYHDGTRNYIDSDTTELRLQTSELRMVNSSNTEVGLKAVEDGAVTLYYDANAKLATTSTGIDVTGTVTADGLTVDTDTLHVDAANNRVGIGTSLPSRNLDIQGTGDTLVSIVSPAANQAALFFGDTDSDSVGRVAYDNSDNSMRFNTNGSEAMRIDASGNVGIGVTPATLLDIKEGTAATDAIIGITAGTGGRAQIRSEAQADNTSSELSFHTMAGSSTSERARIDSSGNLLVGKTASDYNTAGIEIDGGNDRLFVTRAGTPVLINRKSTDGDLVSFYRDTAAVGSIGTAGSQIYIGTGASGLFFNSSTNQIYPLNTSTQANEDGTQDLGRSTARFKDLYLSGTANVGSQVKFNAHSGYDERTIGLDSTGLYVYNATDSRYDLSIDGSGNLLVGKTNTTFATSGFVANANGMSATRNGGACVQINRTGTDGNIQEFYNDGAIAGSISVAGSTVSYNPFMGSHYSETADTGMLFGTVMEATGDLVENQYTAQKRLTKTQVSTTSESAAVYGVWIGAMEGGGETIAAVGASWCRINSSATIAIGDLLTSNGDGTAKVQSDDIIRSKTIGKVTSTTIKETHADGSYVVPVVLYCG